MKMIWEDLVDDFLSVSCRMKADERELALQTLRKERIEGEYLEVYPAFSVGGHMMIVLPQEGVKKCFFYFRGEKSVAERPIDPLLF